MTRLSNRHQTIDRARSLKPLALGSPLPLGFAAQILLLTSLLLGGGGTANAETGTAPPMPDPLWQTEGSLPTEIDGTPKAEYEILATAGQPLIIEVEQAEFDSLLIVQYPDGQTVAMNDDSALLNLTLEDFDYRDLRNPGLFFDVATSGSYQLQVQSFSGLGGDYRVMVRPATAFEAAFFRGMAFAKTQAYGQASAAFQQALCLNPHHPRPYIEYTAAQINAVRQAQTDQGSSSPIISDHSLRQRAIAAFTQAELHLQSYPAARGRDYWLAYVQRQLAVWHEVDQALVQSGQAPFLSPTTLPESDAPWSPQNCQGKTD